MVKNINANLKQVLVLDIDIHVFERTFGYVCYGMLGMSLKCQFFASCGNVSSSRLEVPRTSYLWQGKCEWAVCSSLN